MLHGKEGCVLQYDNRSWQRRRLDLEVSDPLSFYEYTQASVEVIGTRQAVTQVVEKLLLDKRHRVGVPG